MPYKNIPLFKQCSKCHQEFPNTPEYFYSKSKGYLDNDCKTCNNASRRQRYSDNIDRERSNQRQRRKDDPIKFRERDKNRPNKKERIEKLKQDLKNDPVRRKKYWNKWASQHNDEWNAKRRFRYKNDLEYRQRKKRQAKKSKGYIRYRARKFNAPGFFTGDDTQRQYDKQQGLCYWCSNPLNGIYHADHYIPLSRNGTNYPSNIVIACPRCNHEHLNKIPYIEWQPRNPLKL